jgi:hypothetical protein
VRTVARTANKHEVSASQSWDSAARLAGRVNDYELQIKKLTPLLLTGVGHSNKTVGDICLRYCSHFVSF